MNFATEVFRLCHRRQAKGFLKYHGEGPSRDLNKDALEEVADAINMIDMQTLKVSSLEPPEDSERLYRMLKCYASAKFLLGQCAAHLIIARDFERRLLPELHTEPEDIERFGWEPNPWEGGAVGPIPGDTDTPDREVHEGHKAPFNPSP